ncbi:MAG: nucleoside monophosphate kinase [Candidatus Pacebacteria bacterium]|nr:nucleoside monophosphate kinase [Candidatus Paceibacterota bacterium]
MGKQTFIFCGRSGCGKGTQAKLLATYLTEHDSARKIFSYATGDGFRKLFEQDTYTANLSKEITRNGLLQPLFLTIAMWGNAFMKNLGPDDHLFIDGYPRVEAEAIAVVSALSFYQRTKPIIIDFQVSRESSRTRMEKRARSDDTSENIETRLDWYDQDVVPAVAHLKQQPEYLYWSIDGEQTIDEIHQEIISRIHKLS